MNGGASGQMTETKSVHTELLSPAGSFDSARAAANAGADAIYMGGPFFSARAYAESSAGAGKAEASGSARKRQEAPEPEQQDMLLRALDFCHLRGVKVYMTLNTLLKEKELAGLETYLLPYVEKHLDGVIVQDFGVFGRVRALFPDLPLHISTQAVVTGWRTAKRMVEMGAKRIVLARELSLPEIREIRDRSKAELEVFAHGALCYSYSGACLMSSFIGERSGNRGKCAGTCRLPFDLYDREGRRRNRKEEQYLLSMCDLNTVGRLAEMAEAGVYSFKIEGRMKSPLYTAGVTSVYRKYLDLAEQMICGREPDPDAGSIGRNGPGNASVHGTGAYRVKKKDLEMLSDIFDRAGTTSGYLDGMNGREMLTLLAKPDFRNRNERIMEALKETYLDHDRKVSVEAELELKQGYPAVLTLQSGGTRIRTESEQPVETAVGRPVTEAEVREKISKFGNTDFELRRLDVYMEDACFVPVRILNELRRNAADELKKSLLGNS
ncbi:MAG: U32 family peptidase [Lachnospiraceae bacterium]|nr:U32 family peptidase [Lachnospiraceae bacterium]